MKHLRTYGRKQKSTNATYGTKGTTNRLGNLRASRNIEEVETLQKAAWEIGVAPI